MPYERSPPTGVLRRRRIVSTHIVIFVLAGPAFRTTRSSITKKRGKKSARTERKTAAVESFCFSRARARRKRPLQFPRRRRVKHNDGSRRRPGVRQKAWPIRTNIVMTTTGTLVDRTPLEACVSRVAKRFCLNEICGESSTVRSCSSKRIENVELWVYFLFFALDTECSLGAT